MSFRGHPGTKDGIYRIKVYNSERDHYWKYDPSSQRVQLATVDESEHSPGFLFKWHITKTSTAFTIRPAYDPDFALDIDSESGYPQGKMGRTSLGWTITQPEGDGGAYSKIRHDDDNHMDVLGCSDFTTNPVIRFEVDDSDHKNQLFVFQFIGMIPRPASYSQAFGYGSNIWDEQMKDRCHDNLYSCIAKLDGWKWLINTRGVATIMPSPNDHVWGTVLLLHAHDEQELDRYEGPKYDKTILPVQLVGVKVNPGPVLAYIDKNTKSGKPSKYYVKKLKKAMADGKARGIPKEYFDKYWEPYLVESEAAENDSELEE